MTTMEYVYPDYYRQFTCIGGKCPDTCCAGWEIVIDDKTLEKYKKYPGGFGNRLRNSINFITPSGIWQRVSRCPAVRSMSDRI